jgi:nucleoside-triphosphatase
VPAILVTGRPGAGKTTVLQRVVESLNVAAGGFYTQEVRSQSHRVGFDLVTLDGRRATLASIKSGSRMRVSRYGVEIGAMKLGAAAIREATAGSDLIVIDEIGKMELFSPEFKEAVLTALDSGKPVLATVMRSRDSFAELVKSRPDTEVVTVTLQNRDSLPDEIAAKIRGLLAHR